MSQQRSFLRWVVIALGVFALVMGILGLADPALQAELMGFPSAATRESADHTETLLVITSLATINTALLYLVAAAKRWPGFWIWAVVARTFMGAGLAVLANTGKGPSAFVGAAVWEWVGAAIIAGSASFDRHRARARVLTPHGA